MIAASAMIQLEWPASELGDLPLLYVLLPFRASCRSASPPRSVERSLGEYTDYSNGCLKKTQAVWTTEAT